jgi:hypothetical protein
MIVYAFATFNICVGNFGRIFLNMFYIIIRELKNITICKDIQGFHPLLSHNQCCISRLGESIGEGLECNFSVTSAENIGISRKMSQDRGLTRNISEYFEYIGQVFNSEFIGISEIYRRDIQHCFEYPIPSVLGFVVVCTF